MVQPRDNVPISQGAVTVASVVDGFGVQHQEIVNEFLDERGQPVNVSRATPMPTADYRQTEILMALLVEQRITNELLYSQFMTEVEPLETLRMKYRELPVTL